MNPNKIKTNIKIFSKESSSYQKNELLFTENKIESDMIMKKNMKLMNH